MKRTLVLLFVSVLPLVACSDDEPDAADDNAETTTTTTEAEAALPSVEDLQAALLTPEELGPGFVSDEGPTGSEGETDDEADEAEPTCGIEYNTDVLVEASIGPMYTEPDAEERVHERLVVFDDPTELFDAVARLAEAQCQTQRTVEGEVYTDEVYGAAELDPVGDRVDGLHLIYAGAFEGERWEMYSMVGRVVVHVQYTTSSPVDAARANELLALSVEKAEALR